MNKILEHVAASREEGEANARAFVTGGARDNKAYLRLVAAVRQMLRETDARRG